DGRLASGLRADRGREVERDVGQDLAGRRDRVSRAIELHDQLSAEHRHAAAHLLEAHERASTAGPRPRPLRPPHRQTPHLTSTSSPARRASDLAAAARAGCAPTAGARSSETSGRIWPVVETASPERSSCTISSPPSTGTPPRTCWKRTNERAPPAAVSVRSVR